ncbi:hypothetical protein D3C79_859830 [compost metagenome]
MRQVQLDGVVQGLDVFAQAAHLLGHGGLGAAQHIEHGIEHAVDQIAHAQGFAYRVGQGQAWRSQRGSVQVPWAGTAVGFFALRQ